MVVISVCNQKGGTGKSTTVNELLSIFSDPKGDYNLRVLGIDLDQQGNLSKYVGADMSKPSIFEVLSGDILITDSVQKIGNFDFICSSPKLSKADNVFSNHEDIFLLDTVLDFVKDSYDLVILDNNPSRNVLLKMGYVCSKYAIIPTECDSGSQDGVVQVYNDIQTLRNLKIPYSHTEVLGIILTKMENTTMHNLALENLQQLAVKMDNAFVMPVSKAILCSTVKLMLTSLQEYKPYSNPAMDYRKIAKMMYERMNMTNE